MRHILFLCLRGHAVRLCFLLLRVLHASKLMALQLLCGAARQLAGRNCCSVGPKFSELHHWGRAPAPAQGACPACLHPCVMSCAITCTLSCGPFAQHECLLVHQVNSACELNFLEVSILD